MTSKISHGASGAIRRFAGWVARGSVGHPMLEGISYWNELRDPPSQMETCFAIFANTLELDDSGQPVNEKYAEKRAATWIYQYCTGKLPPGGGRAATGTRARNDGPLSASSVARR
jgi:hypothetical protein